MTGPFTETTEAYVKAHLPVMRADADKYARGHLFTVCGSYGMAGAAVMAARAALRTGVGYLTCAVPASVYPVFTAAVPEAVCLVYDEKDPVSVRTCILKGVRHADAVLAGCGLGELRDTVLPALLPVCERPLVLDADGLNYLSVLRKEEKDTALPGETDGAVLWKCWWTASPDPVLTPHEGEMSRLIGRPRADVHEDREKALEDALDLYGCTVLLKGPGTLIGQGGMRMVNRTGSVSLAKAGSGDVLSGIIASLMAQGESGAEAAASGAWIHGTAGDNAERIFGKRSVRPGDLTDAVSGILKALDEEPS